MLKSKYFEMWKGRTIQDLGEVPLYNIFIKALKNEDYELCQEIKNEFDYRKEHNTLCPFSVLLLQKCEIPLYGLVDGVSPIELIKSKE